MIDFEEELKKFHPEPGSGAGGGQCIQEQAQGHVGPA